MLLLPNQPQQAMALLHAMPVQGMLKHFRDEFVHHVEHKACMVKAAVHG